MADAAIRLHVPAAWLGSSLLVTSLFGECGHDEPLTGFYVHEVRHLRTLRLEINGERPRMCECSRVRPTELAFVFVYPELVRFGGGGSGVAIDEFTADARGLPYRRRALLSGTV